METIDFASPTNVDDALGALSQRDARVFAGGTDLLVQLRSGARRPTRIVDIKNIAELRGIHGDASGVRIGAAVSGAELGRRAEIRAQWPGVVEALELIGSTQIQSRASLGGNLCNASPAADSVPALIAANATANIAGPQGRRELAVEDIVTGPGTTALEGGEFIVDFSFPARAPHAADAYLRFIPRTEMDIAVAGAGVNLTLDNNGQCVAARVALGAVAPTAILVPAAADALLGTQLEEPALTALARATRAACAPIDDKRGTVSYRTHIAGVLACRAAVIAYQRAKEQ